MNKKPKISVVMISYNHGLFVRQSIQSVLDQTYQDFEIVLTENGSTDNSPDIVRSFTDPRLKTFFFEKNQGPYYGGLNSIKNASGEFIAFLFSDDIYEKNKLEKQLKYLEENPDVPAVFSMASIIDKNGNFLDSSGPFVYYDYNRFEWLNRFFRYGNCICFPSLLIRREAWEKLSYEDSRFRQLHDFYLWIELALQGGFKVLPEKLVQYRVHGQNESGFSQEKMSRVQIEYFLILKRFLSMTKDCFEQTFSRSYPGDIRLGLAQVALEVAKTQKSAIHQLFGLQVWSDYLEENTSDNFQAFQEEAGRALVFLHPMHEHNPSNHENPLNLSYSKWLNMHSIQEIDAQLFAERMLQKWTIQPFFNIFIVVRQGQEFLLADTLESITKQLYLHHWRLVVFADFPAPDILFQNSDQFGWLELQEFDNISYFVQAINGLLDALPADWFCLLPAGARFESRWLIMCADYINLKPEWALFYTDHDKVNEQGERVDPWFKPDLNLDMLRSMDYIDSAIWFNQEKALAVGGIAAFPDRYQYELSLRMLDAFGEKAFGHLAEPLVSLPEVNIIHELRYAAHQAALEDHLQRNHIPAKVEQGYLKETFRVIYDYSGMPLVSIIIPNKDHYAYLEPCIETLLKRTSYLNYEIIIADNQTTDPDVLSYYKKLKDRLGERFSVVEYNDLFNFSAQCNQAAKQAKGEFLVFLNNDTEIVQSEWLERLLVHGKRPDVGIVGARLIFPEVSKIQHAGIFFAFNSEMLNCASHPFIGLDMNDSGYMNRIQIDQNYSALSAACLMIRRDVFLELDGMDSETFKIWFNDIDLCLKTIQLGLKIVYTPFSVVTHHGKISLKSYFNCLESQEIKFTKEQMMNQARKAALFKWGKFMAEDPSFNRHLICDGSNIVPTFNLPTNWDTNFHDRVRVLGLANLSGSGDYRMRDPLKALNALGFVQSEFLNIAKGFRFPSIIDMHRLNPDVFIMQNVLSDEQIALLKIYKDYFPALKRIQMLDDLLANVPEKSVLQKSFKRNWRDAKHRMRRWLANSDRLIVSTEPLRTFCADMIQDIRVVPNRLKKDLWCSLKSARRVGRKPRVGWVGAQQHQGDLALIVDVVKQTKEEVEWVFMGMCPQEIRQDVHEFHSEWIPYAEYPAKMATLNLDLAIAPLEIHPFNEAKSNLRLLEYGALGWPVVCTDIYPYQTNNAPVTRVQNTTEAWLKAIRHHLSDLEATAQAGDRLKAWVYEHYLLEDHIQEWFEVLTE